MVKKLIKELAKASAHILTKRNPAVRTAKNIIERKTAFQQWLKAKRKKDLPKGADLTDVFKGKNIKDPKTFLKKRKEVVGKMTKSRKKEIKERKQELYDEWVEDNVHKHGGDPGDIPKFGKGGVIKTGIRKAAELKKKMVKAREETLRKSPKGSTLRKITKQFEEEMKAREKLKKLGRGFHKGGTVKRKPNKDRYDKGGAVKKRVGIDFDQVVQKVKRVAGHLKKVMEKPKKVKYKKMQEGGEVKGDSEYQDSQLSMDYAKSILDIARKRKPSGVINQDDINAAKEEFNRKRATKEAAPNIPMPKTSKRTLVKPMQKRDPTFTPDSSSRYTPGPGYFKEAPSNQFEADSTRRPEQDRYTIDEGMVIKPTDDYIRRRLGMKEGGSVSSKPKQRGWGKAIKGTKFKGTF